MAWHLHDCHPLRVPSTHTATVLIQDESELPFLKKLAAEVSRQTKNGSALPPAASSALPVAELQVDSVASTGLSEQQWAGIRGFQTELVKGLQTGWKQRTRRGLPMSTPLSSNPEPTSPGFRIVHACDHWKSAVEKERDRQTQTKDADFQDIFSVQVDVDVLNSGTTVETAFVGLTRASADGQATTYRFQLSEGKPERIAVRHPGVIGVESDGLSSRTTVTRLTANQLEGTYRLSPDERRNISPLLLGVYQDARHLAELESGLSLDGSAYIRRGELGGTPASRDSSRAL